MVGLAILPNGSPLLITSICYHDIRLIITILMPSGRRVEDIRRGQDNPYNRILTVGYRSLLLSRQGPCRWYGVLRTSQSTGNGARALTCWVK